ncbi:hypothetical protein [Pseudomonas chlororaphis]|uniref:SMODS and SLOG-associating 2TM effector domain-containing protein n=1 Tax=Pseudomonas chlororaphis TaxID=587753 RepID=A0AAX3G050_9PSED|nr:hypothetical protein [Pseudomonas chlororaphis]AZC35162.1 hypothetical protein C4K37_0753 [Pseudomonas chlororaphis subsp. piscium]AZC41703.1 hypothetical protein C4K36_0756 [Pseudomonas chlororaphis subsp. piscium]WDG73673.1 hypothetical protein PUP65_04740 [Pseudomonas chlororaphis]WDH28690.1 hypothetical protein PUP81_29565 [Pseudomonas chlororaphis]WDH72194.1 hypothetical protein PUP78_04740 [Pseudomonas chlororaphis]
MIDELTHAKEILVAQEQKYRSSAFKWKLGYRTLLIISAVLASAAAIVSKLYFIESKETAADLSSILAGAAAVAMTIIASLDFESNFRINRRSRHQVQLLLLDAQKSGVKADTLLDGLKDVVNRRTLELDKPD